MHTETEIHHLIIRFFSEKISNDERKTVENWINETPGNKKLFNDLREIWLASGVTREAGNDRLEEALEKFRRQIKGKQKPPKLRQTSVWKYAAILILAAALPFSYYIGSRENPENDAQTIISCENGDRTNIILPDGSQVWLNSGSQLVFDNNFKKGVRQTYLKGEAYFSVSKDSKNPFRVKTSRIDVEVLGTEFNLKAYPDEEQVSATLVTGSLRIIAETQQMVIKPNQKLVYNKENRKVGLVELSDLSSDIEWKNGRFVFQNESLAEMEQRLERWFDVEIELADEQVKQRRFTGIIDRESVLEAIAYFGHSPYLGYRIDGNVITLYSK
ncbi:MAG: FecR domain-containing protein [Prolixibacteraceae bacterium]|jgi:ferric-dicitrate binding protein FerR (iron transport regulator)|nr:FecR domain-containing protein [Prolixibacteraceae bacterium]